MNLKPYKTIVPLIHIGLLLIVAGCSSLTGRQIDDQQVNDYVKDKPPMLRAHYKKIITEGERNAVLNNLETAVGAMEMNEWGLAKTSLDEAITRIESVYSDEDNAKKAKSVWHAEGMKDFKGEPYERAMAYYYRGLIDLFALDYENARASFKNGQLQDRWSSEAKFEDDFNLLYLLEGWASRLNGDLERSEDAYKKVKSNLPWFERPPGEHDVLVILETGQSPVKKASGRHHSQLVVERGTDPITYCVLSHDRRNLPLIPIEDVFFQAVTRGNRAFDEILEEKVAVKETTDETGQMLTAVGTGVMAGSTANAYSDPNTAQTGALVGAAMSLIGMITSATSEFMETRADTRYWSNLPNKVYYRTLSAKDLAKTRLIVRTKWNKESQLAFSDIVHGGAPPIIWIRESHLEGLAPRYSANRDQ